MEIVGSTQDGERPRIQKLNNQQIAEWPDSLCQMANMMAFLLTEQYAGREREVVEERTRLALHLMGYVRMLMIESMTPEQVDCLSDTDRQLRRYEWRSLEVTTEGSRAKFLEISDNRRNNLIRRKRKLPDLRLMD